VRVLKALFDLVHTVVFVALVVWVMTIVWHETFGHIVEAHHEYVETQEMMERLEREEASSDVVQRVPGVRDLERETQTVTHYTGTRTFEEERLHGHYHHLGDPIAEDTRSPCVHCHGEVPHERREDERSLINLHSYIVACETCHVAPADGDEPFEFAWYWRDSEERVEFPAVGTNPRPNTARILPLRDVAGVPTRLDTPERLQDAQQVHEQEATASRAEQENANQRVHAHMTEEPYVCEDCHHAAGALLPLRSLGYNKNRANVLLSTEILGIWDKHEGFYYLPDFVTPGQP